MRLSSSTIFNQGAASISAQQSDLFKTQRQMASGLRMAAPADDPVAASAVLRTGQALAFTAQHAANQGSAMATLVQAESATGAIGDVLQDARQLLLSSVNGAYADSDRRAIATELAGRLAQLAGMANTRDGAGAYLFAGFNDTAPPFALTATGAIYSGDDGIRELQVGAQRRIAVSANGADMLMRIPSGNGVFAVSAAPANTGEGVIDPGRVTNPAALTGHQYQLVFSSAVAYDVLDITAGTTVSSGNVYSSGTAITVAGMQTALAGQPAAGDRFNLDPSVHQSVFATLSSAIAALNAPAPTGAGRAAIANQVSRAVTGLDRAFDQVLTTRTSLGTRLSEIDILKTVTSAAYNDQQRRLSELQDLDYAKATTDFSRQKTTLEANQQTFAQLSKLSLFDFLR